MHEQLTHGIGHDTIEGCLAHAARLLPAQGPIGVFIHHNTLHAFESEPFEEAVVRASRIFGTEPFMREQDYREAMAKGRIREQDIEAELDGDMRSGAGGLPTLCGGRVSPRSLRRALLLHRVELESDASAGWTVAETGTVSGDPALWRECLAAAARTKPVARGCTPHVRHRDLLRAVDPSVDADELVHPALIRLSAAFLDQGVASWAMPGRDRGFLAACAELWTSGAVPTHGWLAGLPAAFTATRGAGATEVIERELAALGVDADERCDFIERTLLALRGWAGMVRHLEERPDRAPLVHVPASLVDFLAVRLVLDRVATEWAAGRAGLLAEVPAGEALRGLRERLAAMAPPPAEPGPEARALQLFRVAPLIGLSAEDIRSLDAAEIAGLEAAIARFDGIERRRILHLAFERRHRISVFDGLVLHRPARPRAGAARPRCQAIFCIDERFESVRRHLEELGPDRETFGTAGFFAVAMYYRGVDDWHSRPLCPIVVKPSHTVVEVPWDGTAGHLADWKRVRKAMGGVSEALISGGRSLVGGSVFAAFAGAIAAVPLVARVAMPRTTARIADLASRRLSRQVRTELALEREDAAPLPDGTLAGFAPDEMAGIVGRLLEDIGLTTGFSRIVAVIGHGSSSRNNPHESAYDCGACGGGRGGPNARAFAAMANDARVRMALRKGGIAIPDDTWFVGGLSDTASDDVHLLDLARMPPSHDGDLRSLQEDLGHAARMGAHERSRRFDIAPWARACPDAALRHVKQRSEDLAQPRPEYGHATNSLCVIGRRRRTRGLYLDRRAFLVSYEPCQDATGSTLTRTLGAVVPVCAGINLEYCFSTMDRTGYGCGTKLPHNITGLLGVMDGHASDLRTGLPVQTTEIHEPVRLTMVIDADTARIEAALAALPGVKRLVDNRWIRVAAWDERLGELLLLEDGRWVPHCAEIARLPVVKRSSEWYAGHRDDLPPAQVLAAMGDAAPGRAA